MKIEDWEEPFFRGDRSHPKKLTPELWFSYCEKKAGSIGKMAATLGISRQTIHQSWHGRFPANKPQYVRTAEQVWGVPGQYLAPELYW